MGGGGKGVRSESGLTCCHQFIVLVLLKEQGQSRGSHSEKDLGKQKEEWNLLVQPIRVQQI